MDPKSASRASVLALRWTVRIVSLLFVAFWLFILIGEYLDARRHPQNPPIAIGTIVELTIINVSMLGLLLAWKWEFVGGTVALVAFVVTCVMNPGTLLLYPVAIAAILFLTCWWFTRPHPPSVPIDNPK